MDTIVLTTHLQEVLNASYFDHCNWTATTNLTFNFTAFVNVGACVSDLHLYAGWHETPESCFEYCLTTQDNSTVIVDCTDHNGTTGTGCGWCYCESGCSSVYDCGAATGTH